MAGLRAAGGDKMVARRLELGRPVLGHLRRHASAVRAAGVEHGIQSDGLRGLAGARWSGSTPGCLPHMGWKHGPPAPPGSVLFAGIAPGTRFYFVHSYAPAVTRCRTARRSRAR